MTLPCTTETLNIAADLLNRGGVVVIPTDTVYGLAAHPAFPDAVARLYTIKNRAEAKPIALLAADADAVTSFGAQLPPAAADVAARNWPGALTLVLPCNGGTEGFRVPDHAWTRALLRACGGVLRVTSANMSGQCPATDAPAALAALGLSADLICDDGTSPGGVPSTVLSVSATNAVTILRPGPVK